MQRQDTDGPEARRAVPMRSSGAVDDVSVRLIERLETSALLKVSEPLVVAANFAGPRGKRKEQ